MNIVENSLRNPDWVWFELNQAKGQVSHLLSEMRTWRARGWTPARIQQKLATLRKEISNLQVELDWCSVGTVWDDLDR